MRWASAAACAALAFLHAPPSEACSYGALEPHVLDESEKAVDSTPPSVVGKSTYTVQRGGGSSNSTCNDIGGITLHLGEVTDDRTTEERLGYRVEVVAGTAPADSTWPTSAAAVRAVEGRTLYFHWVDGISAEQESIDFTLRVRAVDLAGNEGPSTEIRIRDDGTNDGGCRTAAGGSTDVSLPSFGAFVLLVWARLRRKT